MGWSFRFPEAGRFFTSQLVADPHTMPPTLLGFIQPDGTHKKAVVISLTSNIGRKSRKLQLVFRFPTSETDKIEKQGDSGNRWAFLPAAPLTDYLRYQSSASDLRFPSASTMALAHSRGTFGTLLPRSVRFSRPMAKKENSGTGEVESRKPSISLSKRRGKCNPHWVAR